jgi:hypothetical protein
VSDWPAPPPIAPAPPARARSTPLSVPSGIAFLVALGLVIEVATPSSGDVIEESTFGYTGSEQTLWHQVLFQGTAGANFRIYWTDLAPMGADQSPRLVLWSARNSAAQSGSGRVVSDRRLTVDAQPCEEVVLRNKEGDDRERYCLAGTRLYEVIVTSLPGRGRTSSFGSMRSSTHSRS